MAEIGNSTPLWSTARTMPLNGPPATGPLAPGATDAAPALAGDAYQGSGTPAPGASVGGSPYSDVVARAMAAQAAQAQETQATPVVPETPATGNSSSGTSGSWTDPVETTVWELPAYTTPTEAAPEPPPPPPPVAAQPEPDPLPPPPVAPQPEPEPVTPPPAPEGPVYTDVWSDTITGGTFESWGDPHEVTGDGLKFDNYKIGTFVAFRSVEGDLELQKRQARLNDKETGIFNVEASLTVGANRISYEAGSNTLLINGQRKAVTPGETYTLADGTRVAIGVAKNRKGETQEGQPSLTIHSPKGDRITLQDQGNYLNFEGEISNRRASGSVFGSLGTFDSDNNKDNDMRLPDGTVTADVEAFLESWRVS